VITGTLIVPKLMYDLLNPQNHEQARN